MSAVGRNVYIITSCKGGIGKSTVAANLAATLALNGRRTLLVDCDFSNRSLDLILGFEDRVVFDICDLVAGRVAPDRAVISDSRADELYFIPAPLIKNDEFTAEQFAAAVEGAADAVNAEFVFIDTPGASDDTISLVAPIADGAIIVASHQPTSIRGAEKMGYILDDLNIKHQYLIINMFDGNAVISGERPGVNELIDKTHIELLGVIPTSSALASEQEKGRLAVENAKPIPNKRRGAELPIEKRVKKGCREAALSFNETARRLCGERVPLMSDMPARKRRKLLYS